MYQSVDKSRIPCFLFVLLVMSSNLTQASVVKYNVTGIFADAIYPTQFDGSFDWNGTEVSNFHGTMNSSMYKVDDINPINRVSYPLIHLDYQLAQSVNDNVVTISVFKENTMDLYRGGGYKTGDSSRYGGEYWARNGDFITEIQNDNAYFTMAFDKMTMVGVLDDMVYGDCTPGGMMGLTCMTGHTNANVGYFGSMGAFPLSLEVTAVPVPAAVWLFGSALLGMVSVSRKRTLSV